MSRSFLFIKSLAFVFLVQASAADVALSWNANPLAFVFSEDGRSADMVGGGGFAELESSCFRSVSVTAAFKADAVREQSWAAAGVAVVADGGNYWRLAIGRSPTASGGTRYFELAECRNGAWLAQVADRLPGGVEVAAEGWTLGQSYVLSLSLDAAGVVGEARSTDGRVLYRARYRFGKDVAAVTHGRAALHMGCGVTGTASNFVIAQADPCPAESPAPCLDYAPSDSDGTEETAASGYFRVEKSSDGRWWTVDPFGRFFVPRGVDHVTYHGFKCERTGRYAYQESNARRFSGKSAWEAHALGRLKDWGFNILGAGCDEALMHRGLGHTIFLSIGNTMCEPTYPEEFRIRPNLGAPCTAFPNVFHPRFAQWCDYMARRHCTPNRDDPWLVGYFIDNELAWWGDWGSGLDTGLYDRVMTLSNGHSAKQAALKFLEDRGASPATVTKALKRDFLALIAEKYFSMTSAAIRKHDPHHLVMGCRFAGIDGADEIVWKTAGRFCDLLTFNCYPIANLDRNVVTLTGHPGTLAEVIQKRYEAVGRPFFITEWSFPALDSGLPCTAGAGQRFFTQAERTRASRLFVETVLALPCVLGYDYFMWVDEPALGISTANPENSNYGLVREDGAEYAQLARMFGEVQHRAKDLRRASLPEALPALPLQPSGVPPEFCDLTPAVSCQCAGGTYAMTTATGLRLAGCLGKGPLFSSVTLADADIGSFSVMLQFVRGGRSANEWCDCRRITRADWQSNAAGGGSLAFTGEWRDGSAGFEIEGRVTAVAGKNGFVCEVEKISNVGTIPLDVKKVYFREYVDYAGDVECPVLVRDLWKAPRFAAWTAAGEDGRWFGALTKSGFADDFRFWKDGTELHPDAPFSIGRELILSPESSYCPDRGSFWVVALCGTGGKREWSQFSRPVPALLTMAVGSSPDRLVELRSSSWCEGGWHEQKGGCLFLAIKGK